MPDDTREPDPLEEAINQWRSTLDLRGKQRDELEDHLRSELVKLDDQALSPRERVLIAADRIGDPKALRQQWERCSDFCFSISSHGVVFSVPAWLQPGLLISAVLATAFMAIGATRETFNEIDEPIESYIGHTLTDHLESTTAVLGVVTSLLLGGWLLRKIVRRHGANQSALVMRWLPLSLMLGLVFLSVFFTHHLLDETFGDGCRHRWAATWPRGLSSWCTACLP